ncbi:MAG: arginine repressor [Gemmatimonadetes bacterium]|nr:arginine repressor [Gemmatimonadota bacterium]
MTGDRRKRQLRILELISTRPVRTHVTQSSVSRDITFLKLVKVEGAYQRPARIAHEPEHPDERRIAEGVLTVDTAGEALLVLHTPAGEANRVAVAIDRLAWPDVAGTIAGDDTIFLAARHAQAQARVLRTLRKLMASR